jgi:hypothetical protein
VGNKPLFEVFEPKNQKLGKICAMRVFRFHSDFTPNLAHARAFALERPAADETAMGKGPIGHEPELFLGWVCVERVRTCGLNAIKRHPELYPLLGSELHDVERFKLLSRWWSGHFAAQCCLWS